MDASPGTGSFDVTSSSRWMLSSTTPTTMGRAPGGRGRAASRLNAFLLPVSLGFAAKGAVPGQRPSGRRSTATSGAKRRLSRKAYLRSSVTETSARKYWSRRRSTRGATGSKKARACVSEMSGSWSTVP